MIEKKIDLWIKSEFSNINLADDRLNKRFINLMNAFIETPSANLSQTFSGSWPETKAAYRFMDNKNIDMNLIIDPHLENTISRISEEEGIVFAIEDTTYFNFGHHPKTSGLGKITNAHNYDIKGIILHTTMAVSEKGVPLGIIDHNIYCREKRNEDHKTIPFCEKESFRWVKPIEKVKDSENIVFLCDREADIHEFFEECEKNNLKFLVRVEKNRILLDEEENKNGENLIDKIKNSKKKSQVEIVIPGKKDVEERVANLGVYYEKVKLRAPQRLHQKRGNSLDLTILRLYEEKEPIQGERLEWILLTNLDIKNSEDACIKSLWYKHRWHIENYHKVLKSKCKIQDCRLETADRLKKFISMKSIIAFRIYFLTHISRSEPNLPCTKILEEHEWKALYLKVNRKPPPKKTISIKEASILIAKLGGYLNRNSDPPPGLIVIGRGLERLKEIADNYLLFMGNS